MTQNMSQSSQDASGRTTAWVPRLRRGRERVSALLAAAAAVFVERGYEGATMTEVAARAGASIGSLYQFFPTKALIAEALHVQELAALSGVIEGLSGAVPPGGSLADVAGLLFDRLVAFMADHPAFLVMAERRDIDQVRKAETRRAMLEQIGVLLATASPRPTAARQEAVSVLLLTLMKAAVSLQAAQGEQPMARELVAELRMMAVRHLADG
jgi:AcrR family transcriptional regulator